MKAFVIIAAVAVAGLSALAFIPSEEDCANRMIAELEKLRDYAKDQGDSQMAYAAQKSVLHVTTIRLNSTNSACDYYVDGTGVYRK